MSLLVLLTALAAQEWAVRPFLSLNPQSQTKADTLYLTHFDVGQGDATLITTPRGRRILIDAGSSGDSIAARLRRAGIDTLDFVVSSHNHMDHIGGMPDVFAGLVVRKYLDNNAPCETQICMRTLHASSIEPGLINIDGGIADTVDGVIIRMLPQARFDTEENENSLGVVIQFGQFRAMYTGDSQEKAMTGWLDRAVVPRVQVLKAAHHGSSNGYLPRWQDATNPTAVIVSVGRNSYSHPSPDVVAAWIAGNARVFRTDYLGTIQVKALADGAFTIRAEPADRAQPK